MPPRPRPGLRPQPACAAPTPATRFRCRGPTRSPAASSRRCGWRTWRSPTRARSTATCAINGIERRREGRPYFPTVRPRRPSARADSPAGGVRRPRRRTQGRRHAASARPASSTRELVVCGDGWQLPAMRRLAAGWGSRNGSSSRGWLEPDALAQEFADASRGVRAVGVARAVRDRRHRGVRGRRPVVASATGGIGDWLDDGVSGLMFPAGDARALARALNELLADPERRDAMGAAGKATRRRRGSRSTHHLGAITEAYGAAREAVAGDPRTRRAHAFDDRSRQRGDQARRPARRCAPTAMRRSCERAPARAERVDASAGRRAARVELAGQRARRSGRPRGPRPASRPARAQVRGPSIATTGRPEASEAASVPLREVGPGEAAQISSTSQRGHRVGELLRGSVPLKLTARPPAPRSRAASRQRSPDRESGPARPAARAATVDAALGSSRSASSTSATAAPS